MKMKSSVLSVRRLAVLVSLAGAFAGATAQASLAQPQLTIRAPWPDSVAAGEDLLRDIVIENSGDRPTTGTIVVEDSVTPGLGVLEANQSIESPIPGVEGTCSLTSPSAIRCAISGSLPPGAQAKVRTTFEVDKETGGSLTDKITASGGGSSALQTAEHTAEIGSPGPFGFDLAAASFMNPDFSEATQAASVPASFTTALEWRSFATATYGTSFTFPAMPSVERFKDVVVHLPVGFVGNPSAAPQCTMDQLDSSKHIGGEASNVPACAADTQVGIVHIYINGEPRTVGLFNIVPSYGAASELGFNVYKTAILLYGYVRPGDHGIDIVSRMTSTSAPISRVDVTVWGDPVNPSHDLSRDRCLDTLFSGPNGQSCPSAAPRKAFLRMPTSCPGTPLQFGVESNSYPKPDTWAKARFTGPTMNRCELVPFSPQITVDPTGTMANSPTGVSVKVSLPQNQDPEGLAEADLKKAVVTLPEGMAINPSSADGLRDCDDAHLHLESNTPAECPDASKLGTVVLHTQLISNAIEGSIYLRPQNSSDPMSGEMFRVVFELRDDAHGVDFKIPGHIQANPITGRLTATFDDNPQLPFEDVSLQFKSGARAPLVTPASCAMQTTEAEMYSWAEPSVAVHRASGFQLTAGAGGTPCPAPLSPFEPGFSSGVTNVEAGAYTSFLTTFSRKDSDQSLERVSVKMPMGLSGSLVGLPLCGEAQANAGTCSPDSQIGSFTAGAGAGPNPFYVTGGRVYMTGPYEGAPFGLSIVTPAKAGPFDLGEVVSRAKVEVDPHTAQLTVTSDPLPQVVKGVPVNLRLVNVTINRSKFVFNPTNCASSSVNGTMTGGQGATAVVSKAFQVTNCAALQFRPKFTVSTTSKASRQDGASLDAKLTYPTGNGSENIAKVKVELPKQLPSRLTTLQKACPAETFDSNPAACPASSRIGAATATTPVLPVALAGPAYFVSHGGQAFPDLTVVLQGYGVTVDLVGTTFISKAGITSTAFKQVPDMPVGSFELKFPQGPNSALAANGNLCAKRLVMPTTFVAQDGVEIHRATPIAVKRCKPELRVVGHAVKGSHVRVIVSAPSAGTVAATARNLVMPTDAKLSGQGRKTLTLVLTKAKRRFLTAHPGRKLRVTIKLLFTPAHGRRLECRVTVLMG